MPAASRAPRISPARKGSWCPTGCRRHLASSGSSLELKDLGNLRVFQGNGSQSVEMLDRSANSDLTAKSQELSPPQHPNVVGEVGEGMIKGSAHELRRGSTFVICGPAQDAPPEVMTQGLINKPVKVFSVPVHLASHPLRPNSVRRWLFQEISRYWGVSIDRSAKIITRVFTAAIRLGNRNDPLVSDATGVAAAFGQRLARLRTEKGLSQEQVADRACVHRTAVSNLEKGSHLPRLDTLIKLAAALEVDPCFLIQGLPGWTPPSTSPGRFTE